MAYTQNNAYTFQPTQTAAQMAANGLQSATLSPVTKTAGTDAKASLQQTADNSLAYRMNQSGLLQPYTQQALDTGSNASTLQMSEAGRLAEAAQNQTNSYQSTWKPVENQYASEAASYGNAADQAAEAARAGEQIDATAADTREANARTLASMGINPNSGRFAGLQASTDAKVAAAKAAAMNEARQTVRDKGIALRGTAVNTGLNISNQGSTDAVKASTIASQGVGSSTSGISESLNTANLVTGGFDTQLGAARSYLGQTNTEASQSQQEASARAQQEQSDANAWASGASALGSIIGSLWG